MTQKKDIGLFYKEKFANFSPQPPASVWNGISSAKTNPKFWQSKSFVLTAIACGAVSAAIVALLLIDFPAKPTPKNTATSEISATETVIPDLIEKEKPTKQQTTKQPTDNPVNNVKQAEPVILVTNTPEELSTTIIQPLHTTAVPKKESTPVQQQTIEPLVETKQEVRQPFKAVFVSHDTSICEGESVPLTVQNATNIYWQNGEKSNSIIITPSYSQDFTVSFTTLDGVDSSAHIHINCVPCAKVFVPTAFTPNGDGLNDFFEITASGSIYNFRISISNSRGQNMFKSNNINRSWDGRLSGNLQEHGIYLYHITYQDAMGKQEEKRGEVLLIR